MSRLHLAIRALLRRGVINSLANTTASIQQAWSTQFGAALEGHLLLSPEMRAQLPIKCSPKKAWGQALGQASIFRISLDSTLIRLEKNRRLEAACQRMVEGPSSLMEWGIPFDKFGSQARALFANGGATGWIHLPSRLAPSARECSRSG